MCLLVYHNLFEVADSTLIPFKDVADVIPKECNIFGKIFDVMHFKHFVMSITRKTCTKCRVSPYQVYIYEYSS